jgi:hypothetical protein
VAHVYNSTQDADIRLITVQNQPGQIACKILSWKIPSQKRAGGVAQGIDPEFQSQYNNKKRIINNINSDSYKTQ